MVPTNVKANSRHQRRRLTPVCNYTLTSPNLNSHHIFPCRVSSQRRRFVVRPVGSAQRCSTYCGCSDAAPVPSTGGILAIPILPPSTRLRPTSRWSYQWRRATAPTRILSNSPWLPCSRYIPPASRRLRTDPCPARSGASTLHGAND